MVDDDDTLGAHARRGRIRTLLGETSSSWRGLEYSLDGDQADWAQNIVERLEAAMAGQEPILMETDVDLDPGSDPSIVVLALTESLRVRLVGVFGANGAARSLTVAVRSRARLRAVTVRSLVSAESNYGRPPRMKLTLRYDDEEILLGHNRTTHASEEAAAAVYPSLLRDLA